MIGEVAGPTTYGARDFLDIFVDPYTSRITGTRKVGGRTILSELFSNFTMR